MLPRRTDPSPFSKCEPIGAEYLAGGETLSEDRFTGTVSGNAVQARDIQGVIITF